MTCVDLDAPIVSLLNDGESLTLVQMVEDKPDEPPRNKIEYARIEDYFIRTHTNYFGHVIKEEISPTDADFEANGYLTFEDYFIE